LKNLRTYRFQVKKRYNNPSIEAFKFLDEGSYQSIVAPAPLPAVTLGPKELKQMTTKTLKEMAKAKKVEYSSYMTKEELVTCIADPDKATAISLQVKQRIRDAKSSRKAAPIPEPKMPKNVLDIFDDLEALPKNPHGVAVRKDKDIIEGQQLTIRRIDINGDRGYQITGKISLPYHDQLKKAMQNLGAKADVIRFPKGYIDTSSGVYRMRLSDIKQPAPALDLKDALNNIESWFVHDESKKALWGYFEIRVMTNDGKLAGRLIREHLDRLGIGVAAETPAAEDDLILRMSRLLWQHKPSTAVNTDVKTKTVAQIEQLLKKSGIDPKRVHKLVDKDVFAGYKTFVEEGISKDYEAAGARYLWAGMGSSDPKRAADILMSDSPGLMSTLARYQSGLFSSGGSEGADLGTGGADSSFVRLCCKKNIGKYNFSSHFKGGGIRFHWDIKELERTDWYAYNKDNFGSIRFGDGFKNRKSAIDHIKEVDSNYSCGNEIMFRKGLSKENLIYISCDSESVRQALIRELRSRSIDELQGKPLEQFIIVKDRL